MFEKTKILGIEEIIFDESFYPRVQYNWMDVMNYQYAMKTGAKFPDVTVAKLNDKYYLVDGKHRIEAYKKLGEEFVTCEIIKITDKKEILEQSIKRNVKHGRSLQSSDKEKIIKRLTELNFETEKISELLNIPLKNIETFGIKSVSSIITNKPFYDEFIAEKNIVKEKYQTKLEFYIKQGRENVSDFKAIGLFLGFLESANIRDSFRSKKRKQLKEIYAILKEKLEKDKNETIKMHQ